MSTATKTRKNQQPAFVTTGRSAAIAITFGMTLLTLGLAFLASKLAVGESYVLGELSRALDGLAGNMGFGVPLLLCWGGAKLLVSARHQVSVRDFVLVLGIFLLTLAGYTLIARVRMEGSSTPYMDYLGRLQDDSDVYAPNTFSTYLRRAYRLGRSGAGGWLGMIAAYPIWQVARSVLGAVFVGILLVVLLLTLFRINPGRLLRRVSNGKDQQPDPRKAAAPVFRQDDRLRAPAAPEKEPPDQSYPVQSYPIQSKPPVESTAASSVQKGGFYSASPNLYEEYFDARTPSGPHDAEALPDGAQDIAEPPLRQIEPSSMPISPPVETKEEEKGAEQPKRTEKRVFRRITDVPAKAQPQMKKKEPEEKKEPEDDPPWDVNAPLPAEEKKAFDGIRGVVNKFMNPRSEEEPKQNSWAEQVRIKQAAVEEEKPLRSKLAVSTAAKPVYTDPVVPITRERIAINYRDTDKKEGEKLDGTLAPKTQQEKMGMHLPYQAPPLRLLKPAKPVQMDDIVQEDQYRAGVIVNTLKSFKVDSIVRKITHGPSITQFAIEIGQGIKVNRVTGLADNLALDLKVANIRMEQVQRTNLIGIEVPNAVVNPVMLLEVLDSPEMKNDPNPLLVALGKDIEGKPILCDLGAMPHLLIAGATGSGKSVCINSIICSLLYRATPDQVKLIMVDPKQVELMVYNDIPHLLVPVIGNPKKVSGALEWAVQEMEARYEKFKEQNIRSLARYNKVNQGTDKVMPNIVVIIDEMADLMQVCGKEIEASIQRLSAKARAAGIYLVVATQRPSVKVITGDIKNNIPSRIAFAVASGIDSSTILDSYGAEKLIGRGDMLYKPQGSSPTRVQGCFTSDEEVNAITDYIKSRYEAEYDPDISETIEQMENDKKGKQKPDEISGNGSDDGGSNESGVDNLLMEAIEMAVDGGQISTSMLQRRLSIGYARAGRLVDEMEKRGIVSHSEGSKPRKTLMTREEYYENLADISEE